AALAEEGEGEHLSLRTFLGEWFFKQLDTLGAFGAPEECPARVLGRQLMETTMPDHSAVRPPSKEPFTEEEIDNRAEAIYENDVYNVPGGWYKPWAEVDKATYKEYRWRASGALDHLASAGRLVSPDAKPRWQVQYFDKAFAERHAYFFDDRAE